MINPDYCQDIFKPTQEIKKEPGTSTPPPPPPPPNFYIFLNFFFFVIIKIKIYNQKTVILMFTSVIIGISRINIWNF